MWARILLVMIILGGVSVAQAPLDGYRWEHRVLLLFTPDNQHDVYQTQLALLADKSPELLERDLTVLSIVAEVLHTVEQTDADVDANDLRAYYDVPVATFSLLLIGKDGGVKRRSEEVVTPSVLFAQIDSMPMRQREMKEP